MVLLREFIADYAVNELLFGILFFLWLFGGALGSLIGVKLKSGHLIDFGFYILSILALIALLAIKLTPRFFGIYPTETISFTTKIIIALPTFPIVSFLGGLMFTSGYGYFKKFIGADSSYLYEVIGFATGGLLCSLIFYPHLNNLQLVSIVFISAAIYSLWIHRRLFTLLVFSTLIFSIVLIIPNSNKTLSKLKWRSLNVASEYNTPYGKIAVIESETQADIYFDSRRIETIPDVINYELQTHIPALQIADHRSALIIGGNPFAFYKELNKYGFEKVEAILLDKRLLDTYRKYSIGKSKNHLNLDIKIGDAARLLAYDNSKYDLIIISEQQIGTLGDSRYFTREFFQLIKKRLKHQGIFAFSFPGAENVITQPKGLFINSILASLRETFSCVEPIFGPLLIVLSTDRENGITLSPSVYIERIDSLRLQNRFVNHGYINDILSKFRRERSLSSLKEFNSGNIANTINSPVSYFYSLFLSADMLNFPFRNFILTFPNYKTEVFLIGLAIVLFLIILLPGFRYGYLSDYKLSAALISLSGFSVMLLEMVSIFLFQNRFGSLYIYIALLIALFMISSIIGITITRRLIARTEKFRLPLKSIQISISILLIASLLPYIIGILTPKILGIYSIVLIVISGIIGGSAYTSASNTISKMDNIKIPPAIAYGYDLYGAGIGALVGTPLILPVVGLKAVFMMILILNLILSAMITHNR